ncbi:MAG TPA: hypothetical protein VGT03_07100 [Candidatus Acidoferrales bacterium]|nr:hypothetical protein [Candidatus Acidoferrales bacterium]
MFRRVKRNWFYIAGCLSLSSGITVRQFVRGNFADFTAGALMGIAIVLLIAAISTRSARSAS